MPEEIMVAEQKMPNMPNNGIMAQMDNINQGTVAIEASRAIAEAQGKLVIAKRFPRDEIASYAKAMEACQPTGAGLCGGTGNYQQIKALRGSGHITAEERRSMVAGNGGQLNPTWVEWLMGFPIGWTDLNASETR